MRVLQRRLQGKPPCSDLFGVKGRAWLAGLELPLEERESVDSCMRQIEFVEAEISELDRVIALDALAWPESKRLMSVPGVNVICAASFLAAIPMAILGTTFGGASTGGTPSGKHGDALISVRALPQGVDLSTSTATPIKATSSLAFIATVENSGNFQEPNVVVNLTINAGGKPIKKQEKIPLILPAQRQTVTFNGISNDLPTSAYGNPSTIKVEVAPVAGEIFTTNNSATYTVLFTLP